MTASPIICFGQQPCGIFPKRFLFAKFQTARRLQSENGGEIVFFYHDSDHDPRETRTILRHRKSNEQFEINFTFENKLQRKYSPLYLKRVQKNWFDKTAMQLPAYVDRTYVEAFKQVWHDLSNRVSASCDTGVPPVRDTASTGETPVSQLSPSVADFCLEMYRLMGLLEGIRIVRSSDPALRRAACPIQEFFVDVRHETEIVRARAFDDGSLRLHEGGSSFITLPQCSYTPEQISPTRDSRLKWMQSVLHCTHYVAGASEQDYLRTQDAPEITYVKREHIDRSDEAYTEIQG